MTTTLPVLRWRAESPEGVFAFTRHSPLSASATGARKGEMVPSRKGYKHFYWRKVADDLMLVCLGCEREAGDPAGACNVQLVSVEKAIFIFCYRCGKKERLSCLKCGEREQLKI